MCIICFFEAERKKKGREREYFMFVCEGERLCILYNVQCLSVGHWESCDTMTDIWQSLFIDKVLIVYEHLNNSMLCVLSVLIVL